MKKVFLNCILMLKQVLNIDKQSTKLVDLKLQKFTISVALMALELQIKIKEHCFPKTGRNPSPNDIASVMLY
jgi:hypothetical protein